tara:strand:+ start:101 stop:400 length:300 start_codon:yes stop_codon:yes gene_type:complete
MKLPWSSAKEQSTITNLEKGTKEIKEEQPILNFGGKRYYLNTMPEEIKQLIPGLQIADAQLRLHEDKTKLLALGRQTLINEITEKLKDISPIPNDKEND